MKGRPGKLGLFVYSSHITMFGLMNNGHHNFFYLSIHSLVRCVFNICKGFQARAYMRGHSLSVSSRVHSVHSAVIHIEWDLVQKNMFKNRNSKNPFSFTSINFGDIYQVHKILTFYLEQKPSN